MPPALMDPLIEAERMINDGKPLEAKAACQGAATRIDGHAEPQALLGFIVARIRRLAQAETLLRKAIGRKLDVPHWYVELGNMGGECDWLAAAAS